VEDVDELHAFDPEMPFLEEMQGDLEALRAGA
jgi:hypothetical protein